MSTHSPKGKLDAPPRRRRQAETSRQRHVGMGPLPQQAGGLGHPVWGTQSSWERDASTLETGVPEFSLK